MARPGRMGSAPRSHTRRLPYAAKRAVADGQCRQARARRVRSQASQPPMRRVLIAMSSIRISYDDGVGSA